MPLGAQPLGTRYRPRASRLTGVLLLLAVLALAVGTSVASASAQGRVTKRSPGFADPFADALNPDIFAKAAFDEPRFTAPNSVWNTPLAANAPLDPSSRRLLPLISLAARMTSPGLDVMTWSTPIYIVPAHQRTVFMHLTPNSTTGKVNPDLQNAFRAVPMPADARPAAGTDKLIVIYQPSTDTMWESWRTRRESNGWHFEWGGRMIHASRSPGYYMSLTAPDGSVLEQSSWGASATSLPLAPGLISFRDLQRGVIDHVLSLAIPHGIITKGVVAWPAERSDGQSTSRLSIPEGAHLRLDPSLDINSLKLPPLTRMIALAAQRYGFIVRDGASNLTVDGQAPRTPAQSAGWRAVMARSGFQYWSQVLKAFPWSHLQLLRMRLSRI